MRMVWLPFSKQLEELPRTKPQRDILKTSNLDSFSRRDAEAQRKSSESEETDTEVRFFAKPQRTPREESKLSP